MDRYIGFLWTLPVPWAGFTSLPKDPEAAAAKSRTIAYQRERIRRWVKEEGGALIYEEVFLELAPDRGSEHILPTVDKLLTRCRAEKAQLILVEFWSTYGWRRHGLLAERLEENADLCVLLDAAPLTSAEGHFDPIEHFRTWRAIEHAHAASKAERHTQVAQAIAQLQGTHARLQDMADALNQAGHRTTTGKLWTAESVRKFVRNV